MPLFKVSFRPGRVATVNLVLSWQCTRDSHERLRSQLSSWIVNCVSRAYVSRIKVSAFSSEIETVMIVV